MNVLLAPLPLGLWRFYACSWCSRRRRNRSRYNCSRCDRCGMSSGCTRYNHARRLRARCAARKRHEGDVPRPLNRHAQPALVPRAHAGHPARQNFPALLHELRQDVRTLVVDEIHLLHAELANLLLAEILPLPARPSAWASAARPAFAPRSAMSAAVPAVATFTPRSSSRRWCLFLLFCHTFHPFTSCPASAGVSSSESQKKPDSILGCKFQTAKLACRGCLFGRRCRRRWRRRRPARTPCGALLALQREFLLPLQVLVQAHGLIFDHVVLHAQAPLQLGNQLAVRGVNLLVNVNPFAMFGHAIRQLPRSPVFGLLDLAALFRASMLDHREHFLDLLFRSRRAHNKNQIVQTFFHDDLVPSTPGHKARQSRSYFSSGVSGSVAFRRLY